MPENPLHTLRAELVAAAAEEEFVIHAQAVRELDAGLIEALVMRDTLADSAFRDRYAALQALRAVNRFLQAHDKWRAESLPLGQLQAALLDLDNGHKAAMLRPEPVEHGRPCLGTRPARAYAGNHGRADEVRPHAKREAANGCKRLGSAGRVAPGTLSIGASCAGAWANPQLHQVYCTVLGKPDWSQPLAFAEQLAANLIGLQSQKGG